MKRILVVDDEQFARKVFSKVITESVPDAEIVEAADGNEAWAKLNETQFDLAILDINMPFINGIDLIGKMRLAPNLSSVICVVVTSNNSEEVKEKLKDLGAVEVISKVDVSSRGTEDNVLVEILHKYLS